MPNQERKKEAPRKAFSAARKNKFARYLAKATCIVCGLVFRSPKYKRLHVQERHLSRIGVNKTRTALKSKESL